MTTSSTRQSSVGKSIAPKGGVLQVVSVTKTDSFTMSSSTYAAVTGLSAAITPSSISSKILVSVSLAMNARAANVGWFEIRRDSTSIGSGDAASSRAQAFAALFATDTYGTSKLSGDILDAPSSDSELTYSVRVAVGSGILGINTSSADSDSLNNPRTSSTITLMEVAG